MCGSEAVAAEIAGLGGARKRARTRMRTKGNGIVGDISMLIPAALVVASYADHPG
jgi:hypothetical protein